MKVWKAISVAGVAALALSAAVVTTSPPPASAGFLPAAVSVDCDTATAGIQASCNLASGTTTHTVDIVFTNNSGSPVPVNSFNFDVTTDQTLFNPAGAPVKGPLIVGSYNCALQTSADVDPDPAVAESRLVCFTSLDDGPVVANGASLLLGTITYNVLGGGTASFTLSDVAVSGVAQAEIMSCNPVIDIGGSCDSATITVGGAAVNTPTPTSTATNTPVPTPTCVGAACPTATSVAFRTVTPTPGPETPTAVPTAPPGAQPTQPGGQIPPGGGAPGGQPGAGGRGPIRLPDTGTDAGSDASPWTWVIVAAATAVAAGGAAGGVYYRRLQAQRGQAQGEE